MAASVADRDRAVTTLQESFIEGRLARDEFEQRVEQAIVSRDFRELLALTADLPVRGPFDRLPAHRTVPRLPAHGKRSRRWLTRVIAPLLCAVRPSQGRLAAGRGGCRPAMLVAFVSVARVL
jgi:hypothetical protein